ncbi:hypothetical protein ABHN11_21615 [Brevibacillus centrosporus]|jgi:hypothetical protein|uniref:hypothetical protein n=1 Tax=Brevibacillus centrosporus TaxID=54910 RepID=UPI003985B0B4
MYGAAILHMEAESQGMKVEETLLEGGKIASIKAKKSLPAFGIMQAYILNRVEVGKLIGRLPFLNSAVSGLRLHGK